MPEKEEPLGGVSVDTTNLNDKQIAHIHQMVKAAIEKSLIDLGLNPEVAEVKFVKEDEVPPEVQAAINRATGRGRKKSGASLDGDTVTNAILDVNDKIAEATGMRRAALEEFTKIAAEVIPAVKNWQQDALERRVDENDLVNALDRLVSCFVLPFLHSLDWKSSEARKEGTEHVLHHMTRNLVHGNEQLCAFNDFREEQESKASSGSSKVH